MPIFYDNRQLREDLTVPPGSDPRRLIGNRRGGRRGGYIPIAPPPDQAPPPQQQAPAPTDPAQQKVPPQYAGPVEEGFSGQATPPIDPRYITQPTVPAGSPLFDGPFPSNFDTFGFARDINGRISQELLSQDPFPQELVPPFNVPPGMAQDAGLFEAIFGSDGQNFQQAEGGVAQGFGAEAGQANVNLDEFNATTRQVTEDELTSEQLTDLLDSDSAFIQNARERGREAAQDRGALSSSIFAGASERAAIEAGLPIASADAQAFIMAASENMAALNQNTLAKMQAATNIAISNAQNVTQANIATASNRTAASVNTANNQTQASVANAQISGRQNEARIQFETNRILADSRERIASTQLNAQYSMQQGQFVQQQVMQAMQTQGQIDLTQLGANIQAELQARGFQQQIDMSNLSQAQRIELEELFAQPRFDEQMQFSRAQLMTQLASNGINNYAQGVASMNGLDLDDNARARGMQFWNDFLRAALSLPETIGNADEWPDFNFNFGG